MSALFLFAIAIANIIVLVSVWRTFQTVKSGGRFVEDDLKPHARQPGPARAPVPPVLSADRAELADVSARRAVRPSASTRRPRSGLLGVSATQASQGLSIWSILVFPALFTAGMTLLDTTDSILMLGAYGWAFIKPIRKLYYNLTITAASVLVAMIVGGLETLNLIGDQLGLNRRRRVLGRDRLAQRQFRHARLFDRRRVSSPPGRSPMSSTGLTATTRSRCRRASRRASDAGIAGKPRQMVIDHRLKAVRINASKR